VRRGARRRRRGGSRGGGGRRRRGDRRGRLAADLAAHHEALGGDRSRRALRLLLVEDPLDRFAGLVVFERRAVALHVVAERLELVDHGVFQIFGDFVNAFLGHGFAPATATILD